MKPTSSPVPMVPATIRLPPNHKIAMILAYMVSCMAGMFKIISFSACFCARRSARAERYSSSVVLLASGTVRPWGVARLDELTAEHFSELIGGDGPPPELVLLGSGTRLRFVAPALLRPLIEQRIGVETMDTPAACRTFNILAGEGRRVVAALLIEA